MGRWDDDVWRWNFRWRRELREWEEVEVLELREMLREVSPVKDRSDRWVWKGVQEDGFSVKRAYEEIRARNGGNQQRTARGMRFIRLWKAVAPLKAKALAWRLVRNKLPTMENINKRIGVPEGERRCGCCNEKEESTRHFFFECLEMQRLWQKMVQWCGLSWAEPRETQDHFMQFSTALGGGKTSLKMGGLWICTVWVLWKWRNAVKFEQKDWNFRRIEEEIKCRFWSWCLVKGEAEANCSFEWWNRRRLCDVWN